MKNFLKKCLSLVLVAILAAGTIGTYLPGASAKAEATGTTETPKYMAKMVISNNKVSRTGQFVTVTPGTTYTFSYQAYAIKAGRIQGWTYESGYNDGACIAQNGFQAGETKECKGTYTVPEGRTKLYINFQVSSGEFYIWNIKFTVQNSNENLLQNADFAQGEGSWINWHFSAWGGDGASNQHVTNDAKSTEFEVESGRKILLYNEELFSQNIENRELLEETDDPMYMAHIVGVRNSADTGWDGLRIGQYIDMKAENTYTLSYDLYVVQKGNLQGWIGEYSSTDTSKYAVAQGTDVAGTITSKTASFFVTEDKTVNVRFECNGGEFYVWNVRLTVNGSDDNLLTNSTFEQGNGSWIGWTFTSAYGYSNKKMTTVEESKTAEETTQRKIVPYGMFASTDIATWSAEPILEETLDFNYKTAVTATMTDGTTPSMTFKMVSGGNIINAKTVSGALEDDGRYSFSFEVLPQQMAYNVIATLSVTTSSGVQIQMKEYSVKEYCAELLADENSDETLKDLIADLLRYGAQTQAAFGKTDTITSGLSDSMSGYGSEALLTNAVYVSNLLSGDNTATYKWKSASLVLDGKVTIRLKFEASDILGLTVKIGADAYDIQTGEGYYYVDIPMMATAFDKTITAQFFVNDVAQGATLSYSVNTYLYRKQNSETEGDLLLSVYRYGQSADAYYAYLNPGAAEFLDNEIADNWDL